MTAGAGGRRAVSSVRRTTRVEAAAATNRNRSSTSEGQQTDWLAAWSSALDDLELDVEQAESLLSAAAPPVAAGTAVAAPAPMSVPTRDSRFVPSARQPAAAVTPAADRLAMASVGGDAGSWEPPSLDGPLPEQLQARAAALLERQLAVAESLTKSMLGNRQQSGFLDRIDRGSEPRSAYVDRAC